MSSAPLVSCIMIFLDGETFMMEAIRSILDQTYDHWELLLVDDGSTDRSTAMARDVAERHPGRVRYLEHDGHRNLGMSASRNVGIANASGKYLAFLDADDVWLPDKLRAQVTVLEAHPDADMVYGPTEYWYSWTGKAGDRKRDLRTDIGTVSKGLVEPPALLAQVLRNDGATMPAICSLLVRRDTVEAVGRFESAFRGPYEDQAFLVKVFLKCPVFVTNECLDRYRQHPNSCCARTTETGEYHPSRPHAARHVFLRWLREYLAAEGVTDPGVWGALKRALKPYRFFFVHRASAPVRRALAPLAGAIKAPLRGVPLYRRLRAAWHRRPYTPSVGSVRFGDLRRTKPISREYGYERGRPVDRYYVEGFLARHPTDVRGRVLEIGDASYTRRFGGDRVTVSDVFHVDGDNPAATIVGDLTDADHVPTGTFDCVILTQTLQLIYDVPAALRTAYRILKPGGVLLATVPGISHISADEWRGTWYWAFTTLSARVLFEEAFPKANVQVTAHGNVLAATAFLHGLAAEELDQRELDHSDREYEMLITIRAVKPEMEPGAEMVHRWPYGATDRFAYGPDTTYEKGMAFLDQPGAVIEDWGCGTTYARKFVTRGTYVGIDGTPVDGTGKMSDLRRYTSTVDCIFMRHVLEHNAEWRDILTNALGSFTRRMVLVVFTPFEAETRCIDVDRWTGIPTISFRKQDITEMLRHLSYREEAIATDSEYKIEHVFYIEK
jgi:glycosyltransferase involved in cell wall biosynthesis/SAM-dependent methyltransferase